MRKFTIRFRNDDDLQIFANNLGTNLNNNVKELHIGKSFYHVMKTSFSKPNIKDIS